MRLAVVHPFWGTPLKHLRSAKHQAMIAVIAATRHAAGLTQRELAVKLQRSNSFVWKLEAGERQLNVLEFIEIAQILGVQPSVLLARFELTPDYVASTHRQEVDPGKINTT
jgi:transcriptional regulator with XRE-family HTH domain